MTILSPTAVAARETARHGSGQFGEQEHSAPESALAADDGRTAAIASFERILAAYPEQAAHAREFIEAKVGTLWAPDLAYVEYDDKLNADDLDAYLRGDDETLDEIDNRFREGDAYEDTIREYLHEVTGIDPSDFEGDGSDTFEQLRELAEEFDTSDVIQPLVRHNREALVQLPVVDDDAFGAAIEQASLVKDDHERYRAIEAAFHQALAHTGIEMDDVNKRTVQELIDETSLDFGFQSAEQWKLRLVTSTEPQELALSGYGEYGDASRQVTVEHPSLLLIDPWNGRSHDARLVGEVTTTIDAEHPARLDSVLGHGSLDNIAGVVHSYYRTPVKVEVPA